MFAIRRASAEDLSAIKTLLAECSLPASDLCEQHMDYFIVLRQGAQIAGCVGLELSGQDALLRSLAIDTRLRGDGLGKRLLEEAEVLARGEGVHNLVLLTTSTARFFEYHGYAHTDRASVPASIRDTPQFAGLCPSSAICLTKSLA